MSAFQLEEATIDSIHTAFKSGELSCRQLVEMYLERIEAYDKNGPKINSIITVHSQGSGYSINYQKIRLVAGSFSVL